MSNRGYNETLMVPSNIKELNSGVTLQLFDRNIKMLNDGILSVARNLSAMHTKITNVEAKVNTELLNRIATLEKIVAELSNSPKTDSLFLPKTLLNDRKPALDTPQMDEPAKQAQPVTSATFEGTVAQKDTQALKPPVKKEAAPVASDSSDIEISDSDEELPEKPAKPLNKKPTVSARPVKRQTPLQQKVIKKSVEVTPTVEPTPPLEEQQKEPTPAVEPQKEPTPPLAEQQVEVTPAVEPTPPLEEPQKEVTPAVESTPTEPTPPLAEQQVEVTPEVEPQKEPTPEVEQKKEIKKPVKKVLPRKPASRR